MRIVYVEDNLANVHLVKRVARMGKHEVINYIDGMDALNNFASDNPDLVLMDIQLAGELTGIEVVQKLRNDGFTTPIIAVTAYAMVGDKERCIEAGCTGYMSKPIPVGDLVHLFQEYDKPVQEPEKSATKEEPVQDKPVEVTKAEDSPAKPITAETTEKPIAVTETPDTEKPVAAEEVKAPEVVETVQSSVDAAKSEPEIKEEVTEEAVAIKDIDDMLHKQPTQPSAATLSEKHSFASESEDKTASTKPARETLERSEGNNKLADNNADVDKEGDSTAQPHAEDDKHAKMQ